MTQTTISLSEALKDHLREVAWGEGSGEHEVASVETLHGALVHILDNPYDEEIQLSGYEETLSDPVKVPKQVLAEVKALRDKLDARDYEEAIRERANIKPRDVGEEPIEVSNW